MKAQGEAMAPGSIGRGSRGPLYWVYGLESKKRGQEMEDCRGGGEKEKVGITPTTSEWDTSRGHHPFEGHWRIPDCKI